jgi:Uma2 family endonuclease
MKTSTGDARSAESEFVVLHGVPWETYEGILEALGEYHLRHTYDEGTLEMRRIVEGVTWQDYLKLMEATPDLSLPHTYDEGTLEVMSPQKDHAWAAKLIDRMIGAMALDLDIPIQSTGRTSLRSVDRRGGLEPDHSYYIANEPRVRCKYTYDPEYDPPPDLVLEVDVTPISVPRMPVFAKIGLPELWRCRRLQVEFYRLAPTGSYEAVTHSVGFPFLKPADLVRFVKRHAEIDETALVREFLAWAREAHKSWKP